MRPAGGESVSTTGYPYFYRLTPPTGHHELAALEFRAMTGDFAPASEGGAATDVPRIARARVGVDVGRAAYIGECCRLLVEAPDAEGMLAAAGKLELRMERFRVRGLRTRGAGRPGGQDLERAVADVIEGRPDLTRPVVELLVVAEPGRWLLGEVVSRSHRGWRGHEQRPFQYSAALPPRIARMMVNLVATPGDSLVDPCCGVGTVLVEAAEMGVRALGCDINPRLVEHAAANLCHHSVKADLVAGDGRELRGRFDGAVLDLPYGRVATRVDEDCRGLVAHALTLARLVAVVTVEDLSDLFAELGAELLGVAQIAKGHLVRRIHWAQSRGVES